jgi:hypothetical protein
MRFLRHRSYFRGEPTSACRAIMIFMTVRTYLIGAAFANPASVSVDSTLAGPDAVLEALSITNERRQDLLAGRTLVRVKRIDDSVLEVVGAIRIVAPFDSLWKLAMDPVRFRGARASVTVGTFGNPPTPSDARDIPLDRGDMLDLRRCRIGECSWKIRADYVERLQRDVDWSNPAADARAATIVREMIVTHAREFLESGAQAIGLSADRIPHQDRALDHQLVMAGMPGLHLLEEEHRDQLLASDRRSECDKLFWAVEAVRKPVVSLTEVCVGALDSRRFGAVGYRQFWANHYFRAAVEIVWVLAVDERTTSVAVVRHTLVDPPKGVTSKLAWKGIKAAAHDRMEELLRRTHEAE